MGHQLRVVREVTASGAERPPQSRTVVGSGELFKGGVIDDDPALLRQSYALRYRVYCLERRFLSPANYPDQLETDSFDQSSVHIGVMDAAGELVATARLVSAAPWSGLPLFRYCSLFGGGTTPPDAMSRVLEVSRLATSGRGGGCRHQGAARRREYRREVFEALMKAIYQASKRIRASHWVAATEPSLQRRIARYGFPFRPIGPESEYSGTVTPYLMSIAEFDDVILSGRVPALDELLVGLEPRFQPVVRGTQEMRFSHA